MLLRGSLELLHDRLPEIRRNFGAVSVKKLVLVHVQVGHPGEIEAGGRVQRQRDGVHLGRAVDLRTAGESAKGRPAAGGGLTMPQALYSLERLTVSSTHT